MSSVWSVVFRKEISDGFRDRRALSSAMLFPLLGPIMISVMLSVISSEKELRGEIELPISGEEYAPNLVQFLIEHGVILEEAPENATEAVKTGKKAMVLQISEDYTEKFQSSAPAKIELILDQSKRSTQVTAMRLERILDGYNQQTATLRLLARGVDPSIVNPAQLHKIDLSTPQTKASNILEMIGMFLIMSAFGCNMYLAIDATAGERERGSLEPLLIQPVSRWELVFGKWLATVVFGLVGGLITLVCLVLAMHRLPLENLGLRLVLGFSESLQLFLVAAPLVLLAGAVQLTLASFAKSFKEAQTYLSITLMLPMLPGLFFSMKPMEPALWMAGIPALGQQVMTSVVLRGEIISMEYWIVSVSVCVAFSVISLWYCVYLFRSEHFFKKS